MIGHASYLESLHELSHADLEREVREKLTDALQGLVAALEPALPVAEEAPHSCVIDDFQMVDLQRSPSECRVLVRFTASARLYAEQRGDQERITGTAEATLDDDGRVTFGGVRCASERAFVPHDVGGGG